MRVRVVMWCDRELRREWRKAREDMGASSYCEMARMLLDLYGELSKRYGTRDVGEIISIIRGYRFAVRDRA